MDPDVCSFPWFLVTSYFSGCGLASDSVVGMLWVLTLCVPRMTEWETAAPAVAETPDIKLFGKWSTDDVQINDISLQVRGFAAPLMVESLESHSCSPRVEGGSSRRGTPHPSLVFFLVSC